MKNFILVIIILVFFINSSFAADETQLPCYKKPSFVKRLGADQAKAIFEEYFKKNKDTLNTNDKEMYQTEMAFGIYKANINNDGRLKDIILLADPADRTGLVDIITLEHNNKNSQNLGPKRTNKRNSDRGIYFELSLYENPITNTDEFLTQICGNTYMVFDGLNGNRDAYLWKNNKIVSACDDNWLNYERDSFQTLYTKHLYDTAYNRLKFYLKKCHKIINPQTTLRMQNDLALAVYKTGNAKECLNIISDIENNPNFSTAIPALKKAITFNKNNCAVALTTTPKLEQPKGAHEYAWLLNKNLSDQERQILFLKLISQVSPGELPSEFERSNTTFAMELAARTGIPKITDSRYGLVSGARNQDAGLRGILWVDIKEGTSVVGFIDNRNITITSKFYNAKTIPFKAKQDIKKLAEDIFHDWNDNLASAHVIFYDTMHRKIETFSMNWLDNKN